MSLPDPDTFIAAGASAEVYRLEEGLVLKLFHAGIDQSIIDREYAMATMIQATELPVPRAMGKREAGGRQGIVYTEMSGPDLLAYIRQSPHRTYWALGQMARLQRDIQEQAVPGLRSRKAILAIDIEMSPIPAALRVAAIDRLHQLVEGDRLSHGDLHPANLIVTPDGLAAIDWSKAARAAPATDVVRTEMLMRFAQVQSEGGAEARVRDGIAAYYTSRFRGIIGLDDDALAAWRPLVALAWTRHRLPGRDAAFAAYLDDALRRAGLPSIQG